MKPLPRGRHNLPREVVVRDQRERLFAAIAESLDELGYGGATVTQIGRRARVSKTDFYRHFGSKDQCFLSAYDDAVEWLRGEVVAACAERREWADRVCAGIAAMLASLAAEPARANLLLLEGLHAGSDVYARFSLAIEGFAPLLREGAPAGAGGGRPPEAADEAVVGGIASLLGQRILAGEAAKVEEMFPELAEFALIPYLGLAEARRVISSR